jgi:hypothetical protein
MKKTHWKKIDNPNYLGAYSLMDGEKKEIITTIEKVIKEDVKNERGTDTCRVAYLTGGHKPMILNATNSKIIERIYGTPYIEDWAGKEITIYIAKIKSFGEEIECLRIKNNKPKVLPELLPTDKENWNKVIQALNNGYKIDQIKTKWKLSQENQEKLLTESV